LVWFYSLKGSLRKTLEHCQYFSGLGCGAAAKWMGWQPG